MFHLFFQKHITKLKIYDYLSLSTLFESGLDPKRVTEFSFEDSEDTNSETEEASALLNRLITFLAEAENLKKLALHIDTQNLPIDR